MCLTGALKIGTLIAWLGFSSEVLLITLAVMGRAYIYNLVNILVVLIPISQTILFLLMFLNLDPYERLKALVKSKN